LEVVTPGWHKAPSGTEVTIVFSFLENLKKLEKCQEMQGNNFMEKMIDDYHTQVRCSTHSTPHQLPNDVPAKLVACLLRMEPMILFFSKILPYQRAHLSPQ